MTASETMAEYENQKKLLETLQSRLEEAEQQILDGEKLRKKLHNTILVRNFLLNYPNSNVHIYILFAYSYIFLFAGAEGKHKGILQSTTSVAK